MTVDALSESGLQRLSSGFLEKHLAHHKTQLKGQLMIARMTNPSDVRNWFLICIEIKWTLVAQRIRREEKMSAFIYMFDRSLQWFIVESATINSNRTHEASIHISWRRLQCSRSCKLLVGSFRFYRMGSLSMWKLNGHPALILALQHWGWKKFQLRINIGGGCVEWNLKENWTDSNWLKRYFLIPSMMNAKEGSCNANTDSRDILLYSITIC